ncbi:MAG: hypothetical protein RH917_19825 [Lacipirellulaceae bacterium]
MADAEEAQHESASEQLADYSVRYSTRSLLIGMVVAAVLCSVLAPLVRELKIDGQISLAILWASALVFAVPSTLQALAKRRNFVVKYRDTCLLVKGSLPGSRARRVLKLGWFLFFPIMLTLGAALEESPPPGGWGLFSVVALAFYGIFMSSHLVSFAFEWRKPVALSDVSLIGLGQPIPWAYIRGIKRTKHPDTFLLRRYDGDLRLKVPAADVERFLALLEEKTGHTLAGSC